jgi:hypothetical protein
VSTNWVTFLVNSVRGEENVQHVNLLMFFQKQSIQSVFGRFLIHISRNWSIWILKLPILRVEEEKERGNIAAQFLRIPAVTECGFGLLFFRHARRKHRKDLNGFLVWLEGFAFIKAIHCVV